MDSAETAFTEGDRASTQARARAAADALPPLSPERLALIRHVVGQPATPAAAPAARPAAS